MNKLLFSGLALGFYVFSTAQSMQSSEKGRDLLLQMEQSLEAYYGHDMKPTPSYEEGMNEYAHEQANVPLPETPFDGNAHYHTSIHFAPDLFDQIDNATLAKLLTPDDAMNEQVNAATLLISLR